MSVDIEPVIEYPALRLKTENEIVIVIADLHLGIEQMYADAGVLLPNRTWEVQEKIITLIQSEKANRLVILGDIKHTVPSTSWQEAQELPEFFRGLLRKINTIDIVPGNHDTNLKNLLPDEIIFHEASGWNFQDTAFAHGHKWPDKKLLEAKMLILAHNHPSVILVDELDVRHNYSCWVRGPPVKRKLLEHYGEDLESSLKEIILIPSFSDYGGGTVVNEKKMKLLGPFLTNGFMDIQKSKVFLTDGTYLGLVKGLILD